MRIYIGRATNEVVGTYTAGQTVYDNRCTVADGGAIDYPGWLILEGNNSLCYVTNGIIDMKELRFQTAADTGLLEVAGTNSLLRATNDIRIPNVGFMIRFVLPKEGFVRPPLQAGATMALTKGTKMAFVAPEGVRASEYVLADTPNTATWSLPDENLAAWREVLAEAGEDFSEYSLRYGERNGRKQLRLVRSKGFSIILR